jgi:hypothetical protein
MRFDTPTAAGPSAKSLRKSASSRPVTLRRSVERDDRFCRETPAVPSGGTPASA